ncbi:MAG: hypothetical protein AAF907_11865, partial [Planctomycetota bacterium]
MPTPPSAVRTLGGRPRTAVREEDPAADAGAETGDRSLGLRLAESTRGDEPNPAGSGDADSADAGPWEALAVAAVRTAMRAIRAADDGWARVSFAGSTPTQGAPTLILAQGVGMETDQWRGMVAPQRRLLD